MKRTLFVICILASAVLFLPSADAALVDSVVESYGEAIVTGSWSQSFTSSFGSSVTKIEAFIYTGNTDFESPGLDSFSKSGWSATLINPDYSLATGPAPIPFVEDLTYNALFTADMDVPFRFDRLYYFTSGSIIGSKWQWDGTHWTTLAGPVNVNDYNRTPAAVPEPSTLLLLGSGLLGLVGYGRRRMKK